MVALRIALRYLLSRKSHNAVNVISAVSVAGVAVATIAIVCVLSVFNGFTRLAYDRISLIDPDLSIVAAEGKTIADADSLCRTVAALTPVAHVAPMVSDQGLAIYNGRQMPVQIIGVDSLFSRIVKIDSVVIDGDFMLRDDHWRYASLSVGVAIALGARPGYYDYLALYAPRRTGRINPANPMGAFRSDSLIVGSVYQVEETAYDTDGVIVPLETARNLFDYTTEATSLAVSLRPGFTENESAAEVGKALGDRYRVLTRLQQESESFRMISVEKWITFLMLAFILVIASFNVISTLSMLIIEKTPNMATLRALGASETTIRHIFVWEGWLISMLGGIAGIVLGVILCLAQQWGGFIKLNGDPSKLSISTYPVAVELTDILAVAALIFVTGLLVALITAAIQSRRR